MDTCSFAAVETLQREQDLTAASQGGAQTAPQLFDGWFDPIETAVRERAREFIEELIRSELDAALARPRYQRRKKAGGEGPPGVTGHRHGSRTRSLTGSFGPIEIAVPRARLNTADGKTREWKSQSLRAYQRRTLAADALIMGLGFAPQTFTAAGIEFIDENGGGPGVRLRRPPKQKR